jgi:hypothetical protein
MHAPFPCCCPLLVLPCAQVGGTSASTMTYAGPFDCIRKSVAQEGMRVLFRGLTATLLREIPGTAGFFGAYEFCIRVRELRTWASARRVLSPFPLLSRQ